jgi:hypothetical protein
MMNPFGLSSQLNVTDVKRLRERCPPFVLQKRVWSAFP